MKRLTTMLILILLISQLVSAQKFYTRNGMVRFFSATPIENIEAINNQATCIVDITSGEVVAKILMSAFQFEKALMQEHFNENYVESDKYPQAMLKAKVLNLNSIEFESHKPQQVKLEGELTIHNVSKKVQLNGNIESKDNSILVTSDFIILPEDYEIKIPSAVKKNIAKEIKVNLSFELKPLTN